VVIMTSIGVAFAEWVATRGAGCLHKPVKADEPLREACRCVGDGVSPVPARGRVAQELP
jgi:hypothetical protein